MPDLIILGDHTPVNHPDVHAGMKGLIPRDLVTHPVGYSANIPPSSIVPYSYDDMVKMIADQEAAKSRTSDILLRGDGGKLIPSLDQNGQGYCWAYGSVGALIAARARMNLPYVRLSAHAIGWKIKKGRDEGGWGSLSLDYIIVHGCPDVDHWKEKSMSSANDTQATWENAKLYTPNLVAEDLASPVYNRDLSYGQQLRAILDGGINIADYDWQGHCTHACDVVNGAAQRTVSRDETGKLDDLPTFEKKWGMNDPVTKGLGTRNRNSWTDNYGFHGFYVLTGSKAQASNSVVIYSAIA